MNRAGLSCILALLLAAAPLHPQTPNPAKLKVVIVDGEGAINNLQLRTPRNTIVEVLDENNQPVPGAVVVFTLPSQGASGSFAGGGTTATILTDQHGRAVIHGFRPNSVAGRMEMRINASWRDRTGRATVTQFNMLVRSGASPAAKKGSTGKIVSILAIAGAAAAGGAVALSRRSGNSGSAPSTVPSITLTPGTGTIGPPQ